MCTMGRRRAVSLLATAFAASWLCSGCSGVTSCTADSRPGIDLTVLDSETGEPAACGAVGWLISGSWSEKVEDTYYCATSDTATSSWLAGAYEREGVYSVLVLKEGYQPWARSGIVVGGDGCHVRTVHLVVELVPET